MRQHSNRQQRTGALYFEFLKIDGTVQRKARLVAARRFLLPTPRRDADALAQPCRKALEAVRSQRAARLNVVGMAHVLLFTLSLTAVGHGRLNVAYLRGIEIDRGKVLEHGDATDEWGVPSSLRGSLTVIVSEHDRQLREVRSSQIAAASRWLDQRRAIAIRLAVKKRMATE